MRQQSRNNVAISFGSSSGMLWMIHYVLFAFRNADVVPCLICPASYVLPQVRSQDTIYIMRGAASNNDARR